MVHKGVVFDLPDVYQAQEEGAKKKTQKKDRFSAIRCINMSWISIHLFFYDVEIRTV